MRFKLPPSSYFCNLFSVCWREDSLIFRPERSQALANLTLRGSLHALITGIHSQTPNSLQKRSSCLPAPSFLFDSQLIKTQQQAVPSDVIWDFVHSACIYKLGATTEPQPGAPRSPQTRPGSQVGPLILHGRSSRKPRVLLRSVFLNALQVNRITAEDSVGERLWELCSSWLQDLVISIQQREELPPSKTLGI